MWAATQRRARRIRSKLKIPKNARSKRRQKESLCVLAAMSRLSEDGTTALAVMIKRTLGVDVMTSTMINEAMTIEEITETIAEGILAMKGVEIVTSIRTIAIVVMIVVMTAGMTAGMTAEMTAEMTVGKYEIAEMNENGNEVVIADEIVTMIDIKMTIDVEKGMWTSTGNANPVKKTGGGDDMGGMKSQRPKKMLVEAVEAAPKKTNREKNPKQRRRKKTMLRKIRGKKRKPRALHPQSPRRTRGEKAKVQ